MMTIGDFFKTAPHARPVNPRPVTFTAMARGAILPGGTANPHGRPVAATVTAAMVFLGGEGAAAARVEARRSLRLRFVDQATQVPLDTDAVDLNFETLYQELWRILHEWDEPTRTVGARLFPSADLVRELIEPAEARRIKDEYDRYTEEEHPAGVGDATFRGARGGSAEPARGASR